MVPKLNGKPRQDLTQVIIDCFFSSLGGVMEKNRKYYLIFLKDELAHIPQYALPQVEPYAGTIVTTLTQSGSGNFWNTVEIVGKEKCGDHTHPARWFFPSSCFVPIES